MEKTEPAGQKAKPASSPEIMQALTPYLSTGPSGLGVRIGTDEITLRSERREFTAPRNAPLDALIEAAANMSGPLTPNEVAELFEAYKERAYPCGSMTAWFTRKSHITKVRTGENKNREVQMRERTVSSSLEVPMAHIINTLNELLQGGEIFE